MVSGDLRAAFTGRVEPYRESRKVEEFFRENEKVTTISFTKHYLTSCFL